MTTIKDIQADLNKFFHRYKVEKGSQYTNTSMGNPMKSLYIPDNEYDDFLDMYTKCLNAGLSLHLTEKPIEVSPLRVDLDFRYENINVQTTEITIGEDTRTVILHKYTVQNIKNIVKEYFKILNTYFDVEPQQLKAYVQEKEYASIFRDKIKDGVHILFPDILMGYESQHFIRSKMLQSEVFKMMNLSNKIDDVVDKAIIDKNCWLLYGSKKLESEAYQVTALYSYDKSKGDIVRLKLDNDKDYVRLFSMRNKDIRENVLISSEEVHTFIAGLNKKPQIKPKQLIDFTYTSKDELQLAKDLVNKCLSKTRADNYDDWINLGWALYNISTELLETWDEFSQNGASYKSGECEKLWSKMHSGKIGLGSLKYWAKSDNTEMYEKVIENTLVPLLDVAMRSDGSHGDIADVIAKYMKEKVFYDTKAKSWFFVDHTNKWKSDNEGSFIYSLCKTTICKLFCERSMYWGKLAQQTDDVGKIDMCNSNSKKMLDIAAKLKNTPYVKQVIPQLKSVMCVDDFVEKYLDCNINLVAFENKVFDLIKCEFRGIEPSDYISITTGYSYDQNVDPDIIEEVVEIISALFATDEMYSYVLDIISSLLYGKNMFQEFYIMTGTAGNGKSMLMNAISLALGGYAKKINAGTLTKPSRSANETSELYNCKGVRFIYTEEPDTDDKLITSRVKELSGDSTIKTRGLYANPIEYVPQFKIAMCCNDLIRLSKVDGGIARRLRVIEFKYKFKMPEEYDESNPYHKLIDVSINKKFADDQRYRQAFMKLICDNWIQNVKQLTSLCAPTEVREASKSYVEECNPVLLFINEYYNITGDEKNKIPFRDLYLEFQMVTRNKSITETEFGNRLNEMGIPSKRYGQKKIFCRFGIEKKSEYVEEEE